MWRQFGDLLALGRHVPNITNAQKIKQKFWSSESLQTRVQHHTVGTNVWILRPRPRGAAALCSCSYECHYGTLKSYFVLLEGEVGNKVVTKWKQELPVPTNCNFNFHYFIHYYFVLLPLFTLYLWKLALKRIIDWLLVYHFSYCQSDITVMKNWSLILIVLVRLTLIYFDASVK